MKEVTLQVKIRLTQDDIDNAGELNEVIKDVLTAEFPEFDNIEVELTETKDV